MQCSRTHLKPQGSGNAHTKWEDDCTQSNGCALLPLLRQQPLVQLTAKQEHEQDDTNIGHDIEGSDAVVGGAIGLRDGSGPHSGSKTCRGNVQSAGCISACRGTTLMKATALLRLLLSCSPSLRDLPARLYISEDALAAIRIALEEWSLRHRRYSSAMSSWYTRSFHGTSFVLL